MSWKRLVSTIHNILRQSYQMNGWGFSNSIRKLMHPVIEPLDHVMKSPPRPFDRKFFFSAINNVLTGCTNFLTRSIKRLTDFWRTPELDFYRPDFVIG